ncbi:hypothetical protein J7384_11115 [Endozoicomonas sp. G2_1]|uniref:ATP-binding protein n=1 Tax=Endozoicomonas sp. G2_1 TaxID=2821091 RepID=UPI001ADA30FB|nr:ATP-binding protein [Endozoicomonas sp. G2_1]MBO9490908.1 hypothetical protein [Endozoicomonas sp. G2_1]
MKRIYLSIVFTVVSTLLMLGWGLDYIFQSNVKHQSPELAISLKQAQGFAKSLALTAPELRTEQLSQFIENFELALSLANSDTLALPSEVMAELATNNYLILESNLGPYVLTPIDGSNQLLKMQLPTTPESANETLELALTIIFYLGICAVLGLWLIPLTRRLRLLNKTAEQFGQGDLTARVPRDKFSYIKPLEASFNRMANQVNQLIDDNKLLADGLSHDLRTPLACLHFGIDAAISTENPVKKQEYLTRVEDEIERMEQMIQAFLEYANIERQGLNLNKKPLDVDSLLLSLVDEFEPLANQQNISLALISEPTERSIIADSHWLYRLLLNLITNAIHYAKTEIAINCYLQGQTLVITVADDGDGIPPEQQSEVFKPFTRLEKCRNRNQSGFGLGLAMVARITEWHPGSIEVSQDEKLGGACFILRLPLT